MFLKNKRGQFMPVKDENYTTGTNWVNWVLIGLNILIFIYSLTNFEYIIETYGFSPAEFSLLTILTSMFLHGGIAHLLGNMWFLFIFGYNVEDAFGHWKYLIIYLLSGVVATLTHFALNIGSTIPTVGASGAISGVLGAYIVLFPKAGVFVSGRGGVGKVSAKLMIGLWFIFQLISGTMSLFGAESNIAFFAHIGGFVFGFLVTLLLKGRLKYSYEKRL